MAVPVKGKVIEYDIKINDQGLLQVSSASGKLRAAFSDLGGAIKAISADIDRQTAAHGRTISVVEAEINAFNQLSVQYRNQPAQLDIIRKKLDQLGLEYTQLDIAAKQSAVSMNSNISNAGLAGAVLTEFNRTISDANYGFRAVANNLSQLSTLFITLQSKVTESALGMGKFGGTLKMLWGQLNGPLGIILAFQVAITAIEKFTMRSEKAKEAVGDFNVDLEAQIINLERLQGLYDESNMSSQERIKLLKVLGGLEDDIVKAAEQGLISEEDVSSALEARLNLLNRQKELSDEDKRVQKEVVDLLADRKKAEDELEKINQRKIEYEKIAEEDRNTGQNNFLKNIETTVDFYEKKVVDANSAIDNLVTGDRNPLVLQLAEAQAELDGLSDTASKLLKEAEKNGKDRAKNAEEVIKFIDSLEEELAMSMIKTEDGKLKYIKEREIDRLKAIGATDEQILEVSKLYDQLILNATKERIDQEIEEEKKSAEERERLEEAFEKKRQKKVEDARKANVKKLDEYFKNEIDKVKELSDQMADTFSRLKDVLDELGDANAARFERQIGQLNQERDTIRANSNLTQEQKQIELQRILDAENVLQEKRIKNERNFLIIKQTLALSEMMMKTKMAAQERLLMLQKQALTAKLLGSEMSAEAAASIGKSKMSIGEYVNQLGPWGIAAFALSIGGIIASIVSARRQAQAEIASLTRVSVGGGGGASTAPAAIQAPDFNVVGASAQNQLAQAIAGKEQQPIKAYVVSDDVTSAQELDRKIVEGASI